MSKEAEKLIILSIWAQEEKNFWQWTWPCHLNQKHRKLEYMIKRKKELNFYMDLNLILSIKSSLMIKFWTNPTSLELPLFKKEVENLYWAQILVKKDKKYLTDLFKEIKIYSVYRRWILLVLKITILLYREEIFKM